MDVQTEQPKGEIAIMGREGDLKVIWNPRNHDEVDAAKEQFKALRKKGFAAFKATGKDGAQGEQIHDFDPEAGRIIMVPPLAGG